MHRVESSRRHPRAAWATPPWTSQAVFGSNPAFSHPFFMPTQLSESVLCSYTVTESLSGISNAQIGFHISIESGMILYRICVQVRHRQDIAEFPGNHLELAKEAGSAKKTSNADCLNFKGRRRTGGRKRTSV